ncbi:hypothetical protein Ate01nite_05170 [Actinoplanes teichomyceticus]|nr:hypothetical protein Ate01nite_05170 [Actinoplanes teichomyceticus]
MAPSAGAAAPRASPARRPRLRTATVARTAPCTPAPAWENGPGKGRPAANPADILSGRMRRARRTAAQPGPGG